MATIVGVHGIAQQYKGPDVLRSQWEPFLRDGVRLCHRELPAGSLACASYGHLFRPPGNVRAAGDPHYKLADLGQDEIDLMSMLLAEAARAEPGRFPAAGADTRVSVPLSIQNMLRMLCRSRYLVGVAQNAFIGSLKQVTRYMKDPAVRRQAQEAVNAAVTEDTRVIVAHSLGTVVAYEALHTYADNPRWANARTFVTLGSPLGIPNIIFEALRPPPSGGMGSWPPRIASWTNIADDGDIVALAKKLGPLFGAQLVDVRVDNGATAHDVGPYLIAREAGEAVLNGLA